MTTLNGECGTARHSLVGFYRVAVKVDAICLVQVMTGLAGFKDVDQQALEVPTIPYKRSNDNDKTTYADGSVFTRSSDALAIL